MGTELLDRPPVEVTTPDDTGPGSTDGPDVYMMSLGGGRYAANNGETIGPDPMTIGGLACFLTEADADGYTGPKGELVLKTWEEARQIAKSKAPGIKALFGMIGNRIMDIHYVD